MHKPRKERNTETGYSFTAKVTVSPRAYRKSEGRPPVSTAWKGMGTRGRDSLAVGPVPSVLAVLLLILAAVKGTVGTCDPPHSCCQLPHCWDLYQKAQDGLGVRDDFDPTRPLRLTPQEQTNKCISLRTFNNCIHNMTRNRGCVGNLNFHSAKKGIEKQMKQLNCSTTGAVYQPSNRPNGQPPHSDVCSYRGKHVHRHCGLFGDPHLRTFYDEFQTCKVQGAWPLVDNDYLTVMVTNDPVGMWEGHATATSKLTVVIKRNDNCGSGQYMTYQASTDNLPGSFDDGRTHFGQERSVQITEEDPGKHVEIYLRYIDTTLSVRQVGRYFTFAMKMPEEVVDHSMDNNNGIQLCVRGCPASELIDYREYLAQKHVRLKTLAADSSVKVAMSRTLAEAKCKEAHVVDFYYDSCVFDLMTTGDSNFTQAAQSALSDVLRLYPEAAKMHRNRTSLQHMDKQYSSAASSFILHRTSSQSNSSLQRTSQYVLLVLCSILLSTWSRHL